MFREQYIRDNEKLTAKETLLMEIKQKASLEEQKQEKRQRRSRSFVRWGAVAAAILLVLGGALGIARNANKGGAPDAMTLSAAEDASRMGESAIRSYDDVFQLIESMRSYRNYAAAAGADGAGEMAETEAVMDAPAAEPSAAAPMGDDAAKLAGEAGRGDYSKTNVQVQGVDEADIVKTDGSYIYYTVENTLYIVRADGKDTKLVSKTELAASDAWWGYNTEMFLLGDRLMIISQGASLVWINDGGARYEDKTEQTRAVIYDIRNREKPVELVSLGQSGNYVSARMIGDFVYLVTAQYVYAPVRETPITYIPALYDGAEATLISANDILAVESPNESAYTVVGAINLKNGHKHAAVKAIFGGASTLYANGEHLLLAIAQYDSNTTPIAPDETGKNVQITSSSSKTKLVLMGLSDGAIERLAAGVVPGTLINQFAMDEYKGVFRVVTTVNEWEERIYTDGVDTYEYDSAFYNCLYTLDENLEIRGKIEKLADDEMVQSVRFDGDVGYFVTFRQVDPLFAVDLKNPDAPRVLSSLKIPGFSAYLHGYGTGLLLGLGYEADERTGATQGVKLSMFDVADKTNVRERDKTVLDASWTVVGSNHKAVLVSVEKNLIAFPADGSYYVFSYDRSKGFTRLATVGVDDDLYSWNLRGLYIGENLYVLSESSVTVISLDDFTRIAKVKLG